MNWQDKERYADRRLLIEKIECQILEVSMRSYTNFSGKKGKIGEKVGSGNQKVALEFKMSEV